MNNINNKDIWEKEYKTKSIFKRVHSEDPSGVVITFDNFLQNVGYDVEKTLIVDAGCGNGRNSIYLAKRGYKVIGLDFISYAIQLAEENAKKENLKKDNPKFIVHDITTPWPFEKESVDAVIDCNSTIDIDRYDARMKCLDQIWRVLKPRGKLLLYCIAVPNNFHNTLLETNSGPEPNSVYFPSSGKFEKWYTKQEIMEIYKKYNFISLDKKAGSDLIEGVQRKYHLWVGILEKPL